MALTKTIESPAELRAKNLPVLVLLQSVGTPSSPVINAKENIPKRCFSSIRNILKIKLSGFFMQYNIMGNKSKT